MRSWCFALAWMAAGAGFAPACTIPVFRYALERWELTPYEITVFHEGPLPAAIAEVLDQIDAGTPKTNSKLTRIDKSTPLTPAAAKLWGRHNPKSLPWFVVRLAEADETQPDAWAGPLTALTLPQVLDSKARQTVVRHLSRGVTAVFVLLESGKKADDEAAARLLETELARIAPLVKLPEQSADGPQLLTALPLNVSFKTLRVSRDDPAEKGLVRMLLGSEADLEKVRGPIVFPVFGRGRALCSLFGEDLSGEQLENISRFLCGECSCTVKELNPGVDLLLAADWPALLREAEAALVEGSSEPTNETPVEAASSNDSAKVATPSSQAATPPQVAMTSAASNRASTNPMISAAPPVEPVEQASPEVQRVRWSVWLTAIGGACVLVLATGVWAFSRK